MNAVTHHAIEDLASHQPIPDDGILTRTIHDDNALKVVLFSFSAGQELSEHTASKPAVMHFLEGEADVQLGDQQSEVRAGAWIHMAAGTLHAIRTKTPTRMMLYLIKSPAIGGTKKDERA